jgi:hypothetical protein
MATDINTGHEERRYSTKQNVMEYNESVGRKNIAQKRNKKKSKMERAAYDS